MTHLTVNVLQLLQEFPQQTSNMWLTTPKAADSGLICYKFHLMMLHY